MVLDVVGRFHSWAGMLVASFFWKLSCCLLVSGKLIPSEEVVTSVQAEEYLGPNYEVHGVFNNRDLPIMDSLIPPWLTVQNLTSFVWLWVFLNWSLAL